MHAPHLASELPKRKAKNGEQWQAQALADGSRHLWPRKSSLPREAKFRLDYKSLFMLFRASGCFPQLSLQDGEILRQFHVQEGLSSRLQIQYQKSE